ncbi:MAG: CHASE3 domain-containing protein [Terricaulis sp.]
MTVTLLGRRFPAAMAYAFALSAVLLLLVVTAIAALVQTETANAVNQQVRSSLEIRSHYRLTLQLMTDAETGQRGFMLTGDDAYLAPYQAAQPRIAGELDSLAASADPRNIAAAQQLRELVRQKFEEMQHTIDLRKRGNVSQAMAIVRANSGKQFMDDIRNVSEGAQTRETLALNNALAAADRAALTLRYVIIFAFLLIVGIGALLVFLVRRAVDELRESRDATRVAHQRFVEEVRQRELAEDKVRQMQKLEAIGQLTGGVAHDFNNMLAVIISALQLAKRRIDRGEKGTEAFIENAIDGARRAAALTSRLLAFARRTPLNPSVIDVNRVLSEMSEMLRRTLGEHIKIETVLAGGVWRVSVDRHELEQAVLNIAVNARDAMPEGGKLTLESANAHLDEAYAAANVDVTPGQYVMIAVTDTGGGMSKETLQQAFEPFFTTKEVGKGTGLGLSHVHGLLKQSGGHAAIYSEVGAGTTVKLYLPRTDAPESAARPAEEGDIERFTGDPATIILVVEDEDRVRSLSVTALRELGYTVLHANGGEQALAVLEEKPGIALMFTDVVMPGMTGRVLADQAVKKFPHLKVLYTTGYTKNAIVHNGVLDPGAQLLLKPYTLVDLARKIRAVLDVKG